MCCKNRLIQPNGAEPLYLHAWKNIVAHQKVKQTAGQNKNNFNNFKNVIISNKGLFNSVTFCGPSCTFSRTLTLLYESK